MCEVFASYRYFKTEDTNMSLPVKPVSNSCLLIHILYMLLQYYKLVLFFFNCKGKNILKIKDPHKVDNELWSFSVLYDQGKCTIKKGGNKTLTGSPIYILMRQKFPLFSPCVKLQSNQVKRTPQDSINELIIWKMNPLVVPVTGVKLKAAFLHG